MTFSQHEELVCKRKAFLGSRIIADGAEIVDEDEDSVHRFASWRRAERGVEVGLALAEDWVMVGLVFCLPW